jgi:hypothetical protein
MIEDFIHITTICIVVKADSSLSPNNTRDLTAGFAPDKHQDAEKRHISSQLAPHSVAIAEASTRMNPYTSLRAPRALKHVW